MDRACGVARARVAPFSAPQTLDPGRGVNPPVGGVAVAAAPNGRATVAWSGVRRTSGADLAFPVMSATSDDAGRFAPGTELAPSRAVGGAPCAPTAQRSSRGRRA